MMKKRIQSAVVWGDSLARGVVLDEARNRYCLAPCPAAALVAQELGIDLLNRSRMGMTSQQGLQMLEKDLERGVHADAAILEFGGNDCDFDWKAISEAPEKLHLPKTSAEQYENNIKHMIERVKNAGMTPILVNLPPVNAERYFQFLSQNGLSKENILRWLGETFQIYRYQERYSMIVSRVAGECSCRLLDVRSAFLNLWNFAPLFCKDGIHPTAEGQTLIGKAILETI